MRLSEYNTVRKVSGAYGGSEWVVLSIFTNLAGQDRVVAESMAIPGLLHIFSAHQLVKTGEYQSDENEEVTA